MIPAEWTAHRRDDGERIGWIRPAGDGWVAVDLLGRDASGPVEWLDAETVLEGIGLAWLAEVWMLERKDAEPLRVRLVEVVPEGEPFGTVVVLTDDFGAIDAPVERIDLPWPAPAQLRPRRSDDRDGRSPFP